MNRIYSKVWNAALRQLVVASELAGRGGKGSVRGDASSMRRCLVGGLVLAIAMACAGTAAAQSTQDWKLQANGDTTTDVAAGDTVQFLDGANISITRNGTDITFSIVSTPSFQGADMGGQKVTGVAGGSVSSGSKDAVNGGQLYAVQTTATNALDVANQGWNLEINGDPAATVAPGDAVQFQQDGNIVITHNGNAVTVSMKATPNFTGADMGSAKVTNVAGGSVASNSKDAVNGGQLFAVKSTADTALSTANTASQGWKVQVNGQAAATIAPGDTLNFQQNGNILVTRSGTDITLSMKTTPNFSGADMGGQRITHVGAGSATTDAVNVGQLNAVGGKADQLGSDVAQVLGGGATYDSTTGAISSPTYTITTASGTTQVDNVGDALNQMNGVGGSVASGIKYFHANSTLADSQAIGADSVAIGPETVADGDNGFAAGQAATIDQTSAGAVAIGDGATVGHDSGNTVAIGTNAKSTPATQTATVNNAVAIGHAAEVTDNDAVAMGHSAVAGAGAVGIGQDATSTGGNTVAMGHGAQANMSEDIAIGLNAGNGSFSNTNTTSDIQNVYIGSSAGANVTNGGHNVAVGYQAGMDRGDNSDQNVAMGGQAGKGQTGRFNVAIGNQASSSGLPLAAKGATAETVAIGREAGAEADGAISIGSFTRALGTNATTVGYDAYARTAGSLALGSHADAVSAGSIALGANSLADSSYDDPSTGAYLTNETATHILSIGAPAGSPNSASGMTRRIANVAGGALDTDAVNVAQLKQLGTEVKGLFGADVSIDADGNMSFSRDGDGSLSAWLDAHTPGSGTGGTATNPVVYDGAAATSISLAGGASGTQIHNLADGTSADDAVNKGQMDDAIDASKTHYFSVRPVSGTSNENNNKATGDDSLAVGQAGLAAGDNSVAVGRGTTAGDEKGDDGAIAMGHDATVNVAYGTAIGVGANAKVGADATAIGHAARADGVSSVALGHDAQVEVTANPSADDGIAIGTDAYVNVDQGQAYGHQASAHDGAIRGVAIGDNAESVSASDAYAIGTRALANATSAHAVGTDSVADAQNAYAQGTTAAAHATDSQAFGTGATTGEYAARSIAFGSQANTGTGNPALASTDNIAMGTNAKVAGNHSIAVGGGNTVGKQNGTGATATLSGNYSAAFGNDNTVNQDNTFVVGNSVTTTQANSVVLGNASTDRAATTETGVHLYGTDRTFAGPGDESFGVVSVGAKGAERQIINVAAGNISAASTDAVNGSQLYQTNQAVDDFAGDMATYLGGGASHDPNGNVTQPTYNVLGTDYHNVGDAIAAATTHYYSVNDGGTQGGNYNNDGATGNLALAAGVDASASGDSAIAIGNASNASTDLSIAIGDTATTGQDRDIAIGVDANTGAIGSATVGQLDNVAMGKSAKAHGGGSVAIGQGTLATGTNTAGNNNALAIGSQAEVHDYNGVALGTSATTGVGSTYATAIGSRAQIADNASGAVAIGSDAVVAAGAGRALAMGANSTAAKFGASALGTSASASGQYSVAVGANSTAYNTASIAIGVQAEAGVSGGATTTDIAIGNAAKATGGSSIVLGNSSQASGANSLTIGIGNKVSGDNSGAIGDPNAITGAGSYAVGNNNTIGADNAFVLGNDVTVATGLDGAVALGNASTVAASVPTASATVNGITYSGFAGATPAKGDVVSVGSSTAPRQIQNVAAGQISAASTDAINGSQLYMTNQALGNTAQSLASGMGGTSQVNSDGTVTTTLSVGGTTYTNVNDALTALDTSANAGWNVTDGTNSNNIGPDGKVTFTGDSNIAVAESGTDDDGAIGITLNPDLDVTSVTTTDTAGNTTVMKGGGVTVTPAAAGSNPVSLTTSGLDNGGNKIVNVADGTANSDAATVGQMKSVAATATTEVKAGTNVAGVATTTDATDGHTTYTVNADGASVSAGASGDVTVTKGTPDSNNVTDYQVDLSSAAQTQLDNAVQYDGSAHTSVTLGGTGATTATQLTNVADGDVSSTSSDAVNGSQLYAVQQTASAGWNVGVNGGTAAQVKPGDSVDFSNSTSDGNLTIAKTDSGTDHDITIDLADDITVDSVTAGNSTLDTSGLTVDDGTGNVTTTGASGTTVTDGTNTTTVAATGTTIDDGAGNTVTTTAAGTTMTDGTNTTTYSADGLAITGGPTISSAGIDAGDKKITNVKAGTIGAGSLDAINGSQLQAAGDSLANDVLGGNATYDGTTNSYTMTDIGGTGKNNINDAIASANDAATAGWNVADGAGNSNNVGPNGKVTFNGDSNITVAESGADDAAKITVALKDDINVDSVKAGDSTLDTSGLTVDDGAGNVATTGATGTTVTDASGNTTTVAATGTTIDDGAGNTVTTTAAGTTMTDGTNTTTYGADGLAITGGPTISSAGIDAGDKKITNVKAGTIGTGSLDAINGSQLQAAGDSLANDVLGGNATYDGTTNSYSMTNIGGTGKDNINDAIASANAAATAGWNLTAQGANSSNVGPNDAVDLNNSDGNIVVSKTAASNDVTFDLAKDIKVDSVSLGSDVKLDTTGLLIVGGPSITVAGIDAGNLKITHVAPGTDPTDAVNKSQLDHVSDQVQQLADNAVQYDDSSKGKVTLGGPASTDGGKTGGTTISNVHRGDVSANSTDAVNGSQLYETNQKVADNSNAIQNIQNGQGGYFQVNDTSKKGQPAATGKDSTAGGAGAVASGDDSTAVGSGAKATGKGSVAVGAGSVASRDGVVSVGSEGHERQVTNVAAGTESTDAVNVGQLNGAVESAKNWAKNYTDKRFDTVNRNMNVLGHRVDAGVASAMAMASMPQAYAPNQSAAAVGLGQFHGEVGVAVGLSTITDSGRYVFKLNASGNTRGDVGVGVGAAVVW